MMLHSIVVTEKLGIALPVLAPGWGVIQGEHQVDRMLSRVA